MTPSLWADEALSAYLDRLASSAPTPGGGSAACVAGALGASLGSMVVAIASKKTPAPDWEDLAHDFGTLRNDFLLLAEEDERAFGVVMAALRLPKAEPSRAARLQEALEQAADAPLRVAKRAIDLLTRLQVLAPRASDAIVSDVAAGAHLGLAALRSSLLNVDINARGIKDPSRQVALVRERRILEERGSSLCERIALDVSTRLSPSPGTP